MKVFVDFYALANSNIELEEFFSSCWQMGFSGEALKRLFVSERGVLPLRSFPYNSQTINLLHNSYKESEVFVMLPEKYKDYKETIEKDLSLVIKRPVTCLCYNNPSEQELLIEERSALICSSIPSAEVYNRTSENSIVSGIWDCFLFWLFVPNKKDIRNSYLHGLLLIPFVYIRILLPLMMLWPSFFESSSSVINRDILVKSMFGTIFSTSAAKLLRDLLELDNERKHYQDGYEPLTARCFIKHNYSISVALFYFIVFLAVVAYIGYLSPSAGAIAVFIGAVYYISVLTPKTLKFLSLFIAFLIPTMVTQKPFMKQLMSKIFR